MLLRCRVIYWIFLFFIRYILWDIFFFLEYGYFIESVFGDSDFVKSLKVNCFKVNGWELVCKGSKRYGFLLFEG